MHAYEGLLHHLGAPARRVAGAVGGLSRLGAVGGDVVRRGAHLLACRGDRAGLRGDLLGGGGYLHGGCAQLLAGRGELQGVAGKLRDDAVHVVDEAVEPGAHLAKFVLAPRFEPFGEIAFPLGYILQHAEHPGERPRDAGRDDEAEQAGAEARQGCEHEAQDQGDFGAVRKPAGGGEDLLREDVFDLLHGVDLVGDDREPCLGRDAEMPGDTLGEHRTSYLFDLREHRGLRLLVKGADGLRRGELAEQVEVVLLRGYYGHGALQFVLVECIRGEDRVQGCAFLAGLFLGLHEAVVCGCLAHHLALAARGGDGGHYVHIRVDESGVEGVGLGAGDLQGVDPGACRLQLVYGVSRRVEASLHQRYRPLVVFLESAHVLDRLVHLGPLPGEFFLELRSFCIEKAGCVAALLLDLVGELSHLHRERRQFLGLDQPLEQRVVLLCVPE